MRGVARRHGLGGLRLARQKAAVLALHAGHVHALAKEVEAGADLAAGAGLHVHRLARVALGGGVGNVMAYHLERSQVAGDGAAGNVEAVVAHDGVLCGAQVAVRCRFMAVWMTRLSLLAYWGSVA